MSQAPETSKRGAAGAYGRNVPYMKIRDAIVSGELAPGQPLSESALATWCGVSRTPIREALGRLEQDSLITWNEKGLVVRELEPEEVLDIYEVRAYLEAASARTAADRRTERDLILLRATLAAGADINPGDLPEMVRYSRTYMDQIARMARNAALSDALERIKLQLSRIVNASPTQGYAGRWAQTREFQAALVEKIALRDVEGAYAVTRDHFFEARDIRLVMFTDLLTQG